MAATPLVPCSCGELDICLGQYTGKIVLMRIADPTTDRARNLSDWTLSSDVMRSACDDTVLTSLGVVLTGTDQVETITTRADSAGDLGGTYFDFSNGIEDFRVWFDVDNGSSAPATGGRTLVEVDIATGATAPTVATALATALDALTDVVATPASDVVTMTIDVEGFVGPSTDGAIPTTFTFAVSTDGDHLITLTFSTANVTAINGSAQYDILGTPPTAAPECLVKGDLPWEARITAV